MTLTELPRRVPTPDPREFVVAQHLGDRLTFAWGSGGLRRRKDTCAAPFSLNLGLQLDVGSPYLSGRRRPTLRAKPAPPIQVLWLGPGAPPSLAAPLGSPLPKVIHRLVDCFYVGCNDLHSIRTDCDGPHGVGKIGVILHGHVRGEVDNNLPRLSHVRMVCLPGLDGTEAGVVSTVDVVSLLGCGRTGGEKDAAGHDLVVSSRGGRWRGCDGRAAAEGKAEIGALLAVAQSRLVVRVEHLATRSRRLRTPVLSKTLFRCCCTVCGDSTRSVAICVVESPWRR